VPWCPRRWREEHRPAAYREERPRERGGREERTTARGDATRGPSRHEARSESWKSERVERRAAGAAWTGPAGEAKAAASGWSRPGSGATVRGVAAQAWCSGEVPQAYTVAQGVGGQPVYLAQAPVQGSGATLVTPRGDLSSHYTVNAAAVTRRY